MSKKPVDLVARQRSLGAIVIALVALAISLAGAPGIRAEIVSSLQMLGIGTIAVLPFALGCIAVLFCLVRVPGIIRRFSSKQDAGGNGGDGPAKGRDR